MWGIRRGRMGGRLCNRVEGEAIEVRSPRTPFEDPYVSLESPGWVDGGVRLSIPWEMADTAWGSSWVVLGVPERPTFGSP
jgi:hypothetical protein